MARRKQVGEPGFRIKDVYGEEDSEEWTESESESENEGSVGGGSDGGDEGEDQEQEQERESVDVDSAVLDALAEEFEGDVEGPEWQDGDEDDGGVPSPDPPAEGSGG